MMNSQNMIVFNVELGFTATSPAGFFRHEQHCGGLSQAALQYRANCETGRGFRPCHTLLNTDRKSTRLNSSHRCISYAVFCLKKKKTSEHARTPDQYRDGHRSSRRAARSPTSH